MTTPSTYRFRDVAGRDGEPATLVTRVGHLKAEYIGTLRRLATGKWHVMDRPRAGVWIPRATVVDSREQGADVLDIWAGPWPTP